MALRALTLLNEQGDQTLVWDEASDGIILPIIEKKMKEGVVFFIVEPRFEGVIAPKKVKLEQAADALRHRALSIRDEDFSAFVGAGHGAVEKTPGKPAKSVRKAETAAEVATAESVGVKPMRGG
jgi:hypothetical protein